MIDNQDEPTPLRAGSVRVTLRDVAKKIGVSHVTVSLALRNHPSIPPSRREQVRKMAEEMGYRPDPLLSSLSVYRSSKRPAKIQSSLAWLNHWEQPERLRRYKEFDAYWRGAAQASERFGYRLEDVRWTQDCSAQRFEKILLTRGVRGVLIPPHQKLPDWGDFDWNKFSLIRFGMSVPTPDSHLVTADHFRSILMAMGKIHGYGYARIGFVLPSDFDRHLGGNYSGGFYAAQKLFKIPHMVPPLMTVETDYRQRPDKAQRALHQWLIKERPDAVLTSVPEVPPMIRALGYRIPEDIAVAGTSAYDIPVDAGINQNPESIGRIAAEMLVGQINVNERGEPPAPCRILVESSWQDGQSLPFRIVPAAASK
ncbi:MAG: LacI family DNA-binding transcriptional regulator [Akkermansiaceae bacterium]|nr:LacI family DNA-binding transcriptional regulator [Verrucomicrobiales bacterium]